MAFVNRRWGELIAFIVLSCSSLQARGATDIAVFDFELIDTSLDGEMLGKKPAEQERLAKLSRQLRDALAAKSYNVVDIAPVAEKAAASNLQNCGGCDATFAREAGASLAITGTVQKVSNLILNINLYVRDVQSGKPLAAMSADIRSNTDESWSRGLSWLVRNRLLKTLETTAP